SGGSSPPPRPKTQKPKPPPKRLDDHIRKGVRSGLDKAEKRRSSGASHRSGNGGTTPTPTTPTPTRDTEAEEGAESTSLLRVLGLVPDEPETAEVSSSEETADAEGEGEGEDGEGVEEPGAETAELAPRSAASVAREAATAALDGSLPGDRADTEEPEKKALPRVAKGVVEVDLLVAGAARGWVPQQVPALDVTTKVMATWQV